VSPFVTVVKAAQEEARQRGDRRLGTQHLFLGLLHEPPCAQAIGVDLQAARDALDELDQAALAAVGLAGLAGLTAGRPLTGRKRPPLTSKARYALDKAVRAARVKTRHLGPMYLLMALLAVGHPDPVADLIAQLGIDRDDIRRQILPIVASLSWGIM
jgi:ATP-dependent Clp protease ATP-binding subunit ClpA